MEDDVALRLGMSFSDKAQAIYVVRMWHVKNIREFTVVKSKSKVWTTECKNETRQNPCHWYIRIIWKQTHRQWKISFLVPEHICFMQVVNKYYRNLTHKYIERHIIHLVRNDPEIHVGVVLELHDCLQISQN